MNTAKERKKNFLSGQKGLIIGLAVSFAVLLLGYFFIIRPLLKDDKRPAGSTTSLIWEDERLVSGNQLLLYPAIAENNINTIKIHNPDNDPRYVDWGFFYNKDEDESKNLDADSYYLTGYEYAAFKKESFSYTAMAIGTVYCSARIEDHCTDFSAYGLDYTDINEKKYVVITTRDGVSHTIVFGDKLPSGSGYYVRSIDENDMLDPETSKSTGERKVRDSVYILTDVYTSNTLLSTPMNLTTPVLGFPANTNSRLQAFALWIDEDKYYTDKLDENGNVVKDENGNPVKTLSPAIYARPTDVSSKNPFAVFGGMSVYDIVRPSGYYSSSSLEDLIDLFEDFQGSSVVEMAKEMTDSNGESYYGFEKELLKKYGLDDPYYMLLYRSNSIDNYVYFSRLIDGEYYYAYSLTFNVICKVDISKAYFLSWDLKKFISSSVFYLQIGNCKSIEITGNYFDLGVDNDSRKGEQNVNLKFRLDGSGKTLKVIEVNSGRSIDVKNFRQFYRILADVALREQVDDALAKEAMKQDPIATVRVVTAESIVYKKDSSGNDTDEIDFTRPSVTKVFRFYKLTNGRVLLTIEDIDENGKSSGETGSFYLVTGSVHKMLGAALDVYNGIDVDNITRG